MVMVRPAGKLIIDYLKKYGQATATWRLGAFA
jgi:hypothetical protein